MKIKAQDGKEYEVYELQLQGNKIFGTLRENYKSKLLGKYDELSKTCEVMAEATCVNWNDNAKSFTMPLC